MNRGNKYHAVSTRKFLNVIIGLKETKDLDRLIKQLEIMKNFYEYLTDQYILMNMNSSE